MRKTLLALLIPLSMYGGINATAQECSCGFDHQHEQLMKNPAFKASYERTMQRMQGQKLAKTHEGKYVIPIVFHVFGNSFNDGTNLDLEKIKDALEKTNKDFQGKNADWNATGASSRFEDIKAPLNVEFKLAQIDPNGKACTGVEFFDTKSGFGNGSGYDEEIQNYAWDNTKYMNVYIMNDLYADSDLYNSGVAWLPDQWMADNNLARVVYNGSYIGTNTNENFRRVLTHEFGHFLGLHHTFNDGCSHPNDLVEDTPPVETSKWPKDKKNCEDNYTDWQNFMNYTDAYLHYTKGQVERMEEFLNDNPRQTLWQESNLVATGTNEGYVPGPSILSSGNVFSETMLNKGEISGTMSLTAAYGLEFAKTGKLVLGIDYEVQGVPEGLTPVLYVDDETNASFSFTGKATKHEVKDAIEKAKLVIKASSIKAEKVEDKDLFFSITFRDPYTSLCAFSPRFAPCAFINKVEFAGFTSESEFSSAQWTDFSKELGAGLEKGKTYILKACVTNWSSGTNDPYKVRMWVDWNGDFILDRDEMIDTKSIAQIGKPGTEHTLEFEVTVPENGVTDQRFNFRLMLHYAQGNEGSDPCGMIDSGDVEDYGAIIGAGWDDRTEPEPLEDVCSPTFSYRPYAFISRVELNGMINETTGDETTTYSEENFRFEDSKQIKLEKGGSYTLKVDYQNIDSSVDDPYKLRAYVDWNNNNILEKEESQKSIIPGIGKPFEATTVEFPIVVPENATFNTPIYFRVFLHFGKSTGMDGEQPCGAVENGQVENYYITVSDGVGLANVKESTLNIYPNPTEGEFTIHSEAPVTGFRLYSVDGKLVQESNSASNEVNVSGNAAGMYILKVLTEAGVKQTTVIIK